MSGAEDRPTGEFADIARLYRPLTRGAAGALALLDDAAVLPSRPGFDLVMTTDTLVEGVHFLPDDPLDTVARKLLRVNLSDLAAKGAQAFGYLLTTAWSPRCDEPAREAFAAGLAADGGNLVKQLRELGFKGPIVGGNGLISVALRSIQSGESAVLAATTTLWMAVSSMAFADGDRLRPLGWLGLLMGLAGVAVLQWPSLQHHGFSFDEQIGPWFALASAGSWGIGTILLRHLPIRVPRLTSAGWCRRWTNMTFWRISGSIPLSDRLLRYLTYCSSTAS